MAPLSLPPGFGFHPTDEELVAYYLKRKIHGHKIELDIIPEVDLYKCEPWDLPEKSSMHGKESSWHFFSARDRKYPNGARTNRATEAGYWKATGKDRKVTSQKRLIGTKKTLVFHQGRAPLGKRTDWIMHEYRIDESECNGSKDLKDTFVLCRVFKKNGWQTKAEEVEKQIENDIQSSKKRISTDEASEKSSDPQARSPEDIKPLLLPKTHETLQDLPEEVFTVEEMLNMLEDVSEPDNNFVPSEWNSNAMEAESAFKPSPPSEDQDLPWYSEDYTFCSSTGATPEQSNDAEILEELLQVIQASEAYTDNQSHIQEEEAYGTLDYKNVKETNDASENWGDDFQFDQEDAGIQIRPRKQFVDPSESATIARIRMKSNLADIGSSVDRRENHVFHEKRDENEAYLAELQEQIFLLDSFEMQNNGPKISSNCYFTATPTGIEIERNTDGKLLPAQNQSVNCNSGILNVNKNGDAASGSLHNHVVSAMYADTCLMNGGSTEVVESQEQPLVLNESELVTYKGDCKDHQEKQKENNIVGNAKGCSVTDGSENNHEDITSQFTLSRFRRRSSRARPVEGSGDSQEQCHKTINSTSHHINEVTLTESTSSSPTTLILYLCLVGTTFLFFFLFRCILRAVRTVMSVSL